MLTGGTSCKSALTSPRTTRPSSVRSFMVLSITAAMDNVAPSCTHAQPPPKVLPLLAAKLEQLGVSASQIESRTPIQTI